MNAWDRFLLVIFVVAAVAAVGMFIAALQDVFEPKPDVVPVRIEVDPGE